MNNICPVDCWMFSEGLSAVFIKNKWDYIDRQGNIAVEPRFADASGFSDGLAAVKIGKRYGFIDKSGEVE